MAVGPPRIRQVFSLNEGFRAPGVFVTSPASTDPLPSVPVAGSLTLKGRVMPTIDAVPISTTPPVGAGLLSNVPLPVVAWLAKSQSVRLSSGERTVKVTALLVAAPAELVNTTR